MSSTELLNEFWVIRSNDSDIFGAYWYISEEHPCVDDRFMKAKRFSNLEEANQFDGFTKLLLWDESERPDWYPVSSLQIFIELIMTT